MQNYTRLETGDDINVETSQTSQTQQSQAVKSHCVILVGGLARPGRATAWHCLAGLSPLFLLRPRLALPKVGRHGSSSARPPTF